MLGFVPQKGEQIMIQVLEDRNMKLDQGKLICNDLAELEKQVQFHRKRSAMERKRETAKGM